MSTILVTGSSRGIGYAIAELYAKNGWNIVINSGHDREALKKDYQELSKLTEVLACFGDLSDSSFVNNMVAQAVDRFGSIDLLVNNAAISKIGLLSDMSDAEWHELMGINLDGVFYCIRAVLPGMIHRKCGKILNISSAWGQVGASCEAAYSASKGAIDALTKAMGKELAPSGISVNAVSFGVIDTSMNACFNEEERQELADEIPAGRFATPEEAALFCKQIADSPSYLTGQVIRFDGGWI